MEILGDKPPNWRERLAALKRRMGELNDTAARRAAARRYWEETYGKDAEEIEDEEDPGG